MMSISKNAAVRNILLCLLIAPLTHQQSLASEPAVAFDVPATLTAHELIPADVPPVTRSKIIEVVIPVTTDIRPNDRENVTEFRFDVSWNGHAFPVADYGPKSQTVSHVEGTINVDESKNSNAGVGINGRSDRLEIATLTGNVDLSKSSTARKTYQEIPQHHPVIASGTIKRGTGTFFRFHRSRTETLEGGREVVVAFRVGRSWRGGILNVECHAQGQRKIFGALGNSINVQKSFVVPICLEGDSSANELARKFVVAEQSLRRHWRHRSKTPPLPGGEFLLVGLPSAVPAFFKQDSASRPWVQQLIQSGDDRIIEDVKKKLPQTTIQVATEFISARKKLLAISQ